MPSWLNFLLCSALRSNQKLQPSEKTPSLKKKIQILIIWPSDQNLVSHTEINKPSNYSSTEKIKSEKNSSFAFEHFAFSVYPSQQTLSPLPSPPFFLPLYKNQQKKIKN